MRLEDQIFLISSSALLVALTLATPDIPFYGLERHLDVTPLGLIYSAIMEPGAIQNLLVTDESDQTVFQIFLSSMVCLSALIYILIVKRRNY